MSQLRIAKFDDNHLTILNKWAKEQTNKADSHAAQIAGLQAQLKNLLEKNPHLLKP